MKILVLQYETNQTENFALADGEGNSVHGEAVGSRVLEMNAEIFNS